MNKGKIEKILFVVITLATLVTATVVCCFAGLNYTEKEKITFQINSENKTFYLKDKVKFEKKDFINFFNETAVFTPDDDMFYQFSDLTSTTLKSGDSFAKGDLIGKKGTDDVYSEYDGAVLNVQNNSSDISISCYLYNHFRIQIKCDSYSFYSLNYKTEVFYGVFNRLNSKLTFDCYDYSEVEHSGIFIINYRCNMPGYIIDENSFHGIFRESDCVKNAVYTTGIFKYPNQSHMFAFKTSDNEWSKFVLTCTQIINSYEIVDVSGLPFNLFAVGDIYDIE